MINILKILLFLTFLCSFSTFSKVFEVSSLEDFRGSLIQASENNEESDHARNFEQCHQARRSH